MQNAKSAGGLFLCLATALVTMPQGALGQACPGNPLQSNGPDVIVGTIAQTQGSQQISNYSDNAGMDVFSIGTTSCNLGDTTLDWISSNNHHPVIAQNCYRLSEDPAGYTKFEQMGQSWLKHGFCALSEFACCNNCQGTSCSSLGLGCSDPYTAGRNATQSNLGPKWQVNATTGVFTYPPANPAWSTSVDRRLQIHTSDLEVSNSNHTMPLADEPRFYVEGQYVTQDDAESGNKNNNVSWRPINVTGGPTNWSFSVYDTPNPPGGAQQGHTRRQEEALWAWQDVDPSVFIKQGVTDELSADAGGNPNLEKAKVLMGSNVTDLGGGMWHYEYAVHNVNSHRSFKSFSIPIDATANVTNAEFHDVDYHSGDGPGNTNMDGTDWAFQVVPGSPVQKFVRWDMQETDPENRRNALRWGTLYNFRFDADVPPLTSGKGQATLDYYRAATMGEAANIVLFAEAPAPCTPGDLNADGQRNGQDIVIFNDIVLGLVVPTAEQICSGDQASPFNTITIEDAGAFVDSLVVAP